VFEVGTWEGGGSTFFIAQALHDNGFGILHTTEADSDLVRSTTANYARYLPHLLPRVNFHHGRSTDVYPPLLAELPLANVVFLDGGQDAEQTLAEFRMFDRSLSEGGTLMLHDWDNEKMRLVRPQIEGSSDWHIEKRLTWPNSLGFVVCSTRHS